MAQDWTQIYSDWLMNSALPLWATKGVDVAQGGFEELMAQDGEPISAPRRARVQGRQSFVFAYAGSLGWTGPWRDVAEVGLNYLERYYKRPDGLYATLAGPTGDIIDQTAMTYDQAFAILAAAALYEHGLGPGENYALGLMGRIAVMRRHSAGGFIEPGPQFLSNPQMHLFEAALAWVVAGGQRSWRALAREIAALAMASFIDREHGVLLEQFDATWFPAPGEAGNRVEPGHLFEWSWLLERWARLDDCNAAHDVASMLFETARRSVDPERNVAVDETDRHLEQRRSTARLWPQTERLKAALLLGHESEARAAAASLWQYLHTPCTGLWWDKMRDDGAFVEEAAPASSLYHIICAVASLKEYGVLR
ncbi:MAG: AGE family epimerase/isomerase [Alphaproteobacteria bacterium]|nr:AGE family epimerase/isomerase [Alphaproteobacteria bacterium]